MDALSVRRITFSELIDPSTAAYVYSVLTESIVSFLLTLSNNTLVAPVPRKVTDVESGTVVLVRVSDTVQPLYVPGIADQLVLDPSVIRYLPALAACSGAKALNAALEVVAPVPPYAISIVLPFQVPVVSVPTDVRLDDTTLGPSPVEVSTADPPI